MVRITGIILKNFRDKFIFPNKSYLNWFPGHMGKGMKQVQSSLKNVDCIVEVHDARIPISGRNKNFRNFIGTKPHILLLNKMDLANLDKEKEIVKHLENDGVDNILFTNCKNECSNLKRLVPLATDLISKSDRFNRSEDLDYSILVIGVPNVGKSSFINRLRNMKTRKKKAAAVGAIAGVTRSMGSKIKVSEAPLIYILDTPGILEPSVSNMHSALKLALCSSMQDHLVGPINIADYLLYWLNQHENFAYLDYMGVQEPVDNIMELLVLCAVHLNRTLKLRSTEGGYTVKPDFEFAAQYFIKGFREGKFGKVMLDDIV